MVLEKRWYGPTNLPADLVYEPRSRTYFSPGTGLCYVKAAGGTVNEISVADLQAMRNAGTVAPPITSAQLRGLVEAMTDAERIELFNP